MLRFVGLAAIAVAATTAGVAFGDHDGPRPLKDDARWTTVFKPPAGVGIEGLTADRRGELYAPAGASSRVRSSGSRGQRGRRQPARAVQPRRADLRAGRAAVRRRQRPHHGAAAETPRAADRDGLRVRRAGLQRRRLRPPRRPLGHRRGDRARAVCGGSAATACRRRSSASSRSPTTCPAGSARDVAGCRPGRSRSPRRAARRRTRSAPSTWWPTASRSTTTAKLMSPTPLVARSGACTSTTAGAS